MRRPALVPGESSALVRKGADDFIVVTSRGKVLPVTHWIGEDGMDARGLPDAVVCVAGTDLLGWYTITLTGNFIYAH